MLPSDWLEMTLWAALERGASDIHIEPFSTNVRVRFRIDGLLVQYQNLASEDAAQITSQIKVLAQLDIAEKRIPQDGRLQWKVGQTHVDFRISTLPTLFGEKLVLRLQDRLAIDLTLDQLGLLPVQLIQLKQVLRQPHGLILVTGPTGSGKTVSLYAALQYLNQIHRNICTIEDPIELAIDGINQVAMNTKRGLTFSTAMRSFLRQDPDVMMVGEIRDPETADIAIKAAQTGHLVLSTLHTNDAPQTIARLLHLGVKTHDLAASLQLVMAQRLVRKRHDCINGCSKCNAGYKGRIAIHELLPMPIEIRNLLGAPDFRLEDLETEMKRQDITRLFDAGLLRVKDGITTREEVVRVTLE